MPHRLPHAFMLAVGWREDTDFRRAALLKPQGGEGEHQRLHAHRQRYMLSAFRFIITRRCMVRRLRLREVGQAVRPRGF